MQGLVLISSIFWVVLQLTHAAMVRTLNWTSTIQQVFGSCHNMAAADLDEVSPEHGEKNVDNFSKPSGG